MQAPVQSPVKQRPHLMFVLVSLLIYLPLFFGLAMLRARWYGWAVVAFSFWMLFWMHRRPFWHQWRIVLCFACAYLVALAGLYLARPAWDVSFAAQMSSGMVRTFTGLPEKEQALGRTLLSDTGWTPPEGYHNEVIALPHARLELLRKEGSQSRKAILQLHGGAFVAGMNSLYRQFAVRYSQRYEDCLVASLDYRLAPADPYPAQQLDTLDAWRYLTNTLHYAPEDLVVVGDSAGGNLALTLGLRLRDLGQAMPAGFICMSPWADLSNSGPSHVENATADPSFGVSAQGYDGRPIGVPTTYPDGLDATDPYLSPSFGDYHGFPPMLLQAGSAEVLLSDSEMVYHNARSHGVACELTVYNGMFHVFQGMLDLSPESRSAWEEIRAFLAALP